LLATKQKSIFADEVQLREKISELYGAVTNQEARPSNLHIEGVEVLKMEVRKAERQHNDIIKKYSADVARALQKEGLAESTKTF
jgi:hypothetical protein